MNYLTIESVHVCPHCGISASNSEQIAIIFGWRKSFRITKEPSYKVIPQSWCTRCRSKEARRYE